MKVAGRSKKEAVRIFVMDGVACSAIANAHGLVRLSHA
jgi:hypothetical protein